MPTPMPPNPLSYGLWNSSSDERPMFYIKLPHLLSHVPKVSKQDPCFLPIVDSRQWAKRSICIHAYPFFLGNPPSFFQNPAMPFQFPSIESRDSSNQSRHEFGQEAPSKQSPQK